MSIAYPMNIRNRNRRHGDPSGSPETCTSTTQAIIAEPGRLDRRDSCGCRIVHFGPACMTFHLLLLRYDLENMKKKTRNKAQGFSLAKRRWRRK